MFDQPAREIMSSPVFHCAPELSVAAAYRQLVDHQISSMAVVSGDSLVGVVTRADLLTLGARDRVRDGASFELPDRSVDSVMTTPAVVIGENDSVRTAAERMVERGIHRVYVTRDAELVGVVSTRDIMGPICDARADLPIAELATSPVHTVQAQEPLRIAIERLETTGVTGLIVTEDDHAVGMFSRTEALAARGLDLDAPVDEAMEFAVVCLPETAQLHRAARLAARMGVRRIVTVRYREMTGVITGLDFARFAAGA